MDRPFNVDAALTAIAIGYRNPATARIADRVLPRQPVTAEEFKYTVYPIEEAFNVPDARVGRRGQVQQLEFGGTEVTGATEDYGLDSPIPNSDIRSAEEARARGVSTYDPEGHSTMMLTDTIDNIREVRAAGIVFNPNVYAVGRKTTLAGGSQFSDYLNSDPIGVIRAGLDATLVMRPNKMPMGRAVWSKLSSHPKIVNAVKGNVTDSGMVTIAQFAELFRDEGIDEVIVGDAWYNVAKPGQPTNLQRAWGKHLALIHINPLATPQGGGVTFGFTAQLGGRIAGRIIDPDIGLEGGIRVRVGERVKEVVSAQDVGYFIQNAVQ